MPVPSGICPLCSMILSISASAFASFYYFPYLCLKHIMVNALEIVVYVRFDRIHRRVRVESLPLIKPTFQRVRRGVHTLIFPAGVRMENKTLFKNRFQHVVNGVLYYLVIKRQRHNLPFFRFIYLKISVLARLIGKPQNFISYPL